MTASRNSRTRLSWAAVTFLAAATLVAPDSRASGTPPSPPPPSAPAAMPDQPPDSATVAKENRARAEDLYRKGYKEAQDAQKDLDAKKEKDAKKKFGKALQRFQDAVKLDPTYFEAWNMAGFCSRKSGSVKAAFGYYDKALALRPDYEEAHEYLGEAYLQSGDVPKAKEQLQWLKDHQSGQAATLEASIASVEKGGTPTAGGGGGSGW
jgi:predicted Zn-dependent protease